MAGVCRSLSKRVCRVTGQAFRQSRDGRRGRPRGTRAEMGHAEHDCARIEERATARFQHRQGWRSHFAVCAICAAWSGRCRSGARSQPGRGIARRRPAAAVRDRLAFGHNGDASFRHRRLSRRPQRAGRPTRRHRRSGRALPGRLAVAALCRAFSHQGAQTGAGWCANRYCRRAIRIVRARRRQPSGAVS